MKRSEMLSLMYGKLCKEHIVNGESLYVSIERLLDFMEEQGMLPPPYTFKHRVVNNPTGNTISVTNYEWEDEQ